MGNNPTERVEVPEAAIEAEKWAKQAESTQGRNSSDLFVAVCWVAAELRATRQTPILQARDATEPCPNCNATGERDPDGVDSMGLPRWGNEMEDNRDRRCRRCKGKGRIVQARDAEVEERIRKEALDAALLGTPEENAPSEPREEESGRG